MPRLLFEKTGNAVWISHLDLMRLFQRAFKRAGLALTHTQGFNPRPSVSIALPLSVGIESVCEMLDFELDNHVSNEEILLRLNSMLTDGIRILDVYDTGRKIKYLSFLQCRLTLEYDLPLASDCIDKVTGLFQQDEVIVEKRSRNGSTNQNIIPMIRSLQCKQSGENTVVIEADICCQNPSLNPMQISQAVQLYLPELTPDAVTCRRIELLDINGEIFR